MRKMVLLVVVAMMATGSLKAQKTGDFAIGANFTYSLKSQNYAPGIKVQYNFTDWLRAEVEGNYWLKKDNWQAFDSMLNIHGFIHVSNFFKFYPIVGVGYFNTKWSELDFIDPDYGVHVRFDGKTTNDIVGVGGLGFQFNFTDHFAMSIEGKYQFNVGNQFCGIAGFLYIF